MIAGGASEHRLLSAYLEPMAPGTTGLGLLGMALESARQSSVCMWLLISYAALHTLLNILKLLLAHL